MIGMMCWVVVCAGSGLWPYWREGGEGSEFEFAETLPDHSRRKQSNDCLRFLLRHRKQSACTEFSEDRNRKQSIHYLRNNVITA
jgi:hypothetical protein